MREKSEFSYSLGRRQFLCGSAAMAVAAMLPGCGSAGSTTGTPPSPPTPPPPSGTQPTPSGPLTQASLTVTTSVAGSIVPAFAGLSYEKASLYEPLFSGSNASLIGLFKRLGTSVLRIGGNTVDRNVWAPNGAGQTSGQIAPSDVDALADFLKATGWQCLYGINLGGAGPDAVAPTTTALAAEEVAYVAGKLGSQLLGIEIGNEPDLYGGTYFAGTGNWSLSQFLTLWAEYRSAILAVTPGVTITGPADAGHETTWTVPFGQAVTKSEIALLTQHYYRGNGKSPTSTVENLVTPDPYLISNLAALEAGSQQIGVPFRLSECNSYYDGGSDGVSDAYASSLWVVDFLFDCALGGAVGTNFHGGGDDGGYTPIANSGGTVVDVRPEYYGIFFFTLAGPGSLQTTQLSAGGLNATAYAVAPKSGGTNLIVVNKDATQNLQLTVELPKAISSAALLEMTQLSTGASGPSLSAISGVTIQGSQVNTDGSFAPGTAYQLTTNGTQLTCYVPALSAVLIQVA